MVKNKLFLINFSMICLVFSVFLLILVLPHIDISGYVLETLTSKLIYFLYGCVVLLGFYTFYSISRKTISYSFSKLDIALLALLLYIILDRYVIQSDFGFSIRYLELLGLSFLYVILRIIALKNYPWLLLAIIISGIIQAVYGNLQLLGYSASNHSSFKITGSFFNPGPYAGFLVSVLPIALGMYLYRDTLTAKLQAEAKNKSPLLHGIIKQTFEYIPLLGVVNIVIVLPATKSRAAWIAAICSSIVLVAIKYAILPRLLNKATIKLQKIALIVLAIGIVSAGLFSLYHYKKASSDGRAFIWKVTTEMIADTPVFGLGFDRFKAQYMNYQADYFAKNGDTSEIKVADNTYYAFNEGLQFVAENGLLGFLFLMIVVYVLFLTKVNEGYQLNSFIAKMVFLTIGIFSCFSYPMQILPIKLAWWFYLPCCLMELRLAFNLKLEEI